MLIELIEIENLLIGIVILAGVKLSWQKCYERSNQYNKKLNSVLSRKACIPKNFLFKIAIDNWIRIDKCPIRTKTFVMQIKFIEKSWNSSLSSIESGETTLM